MNRTTYKKRAGTSGIQGQLYETKLISLIYFRLIHDNNIVQFSLATNRDDMGAFDDIFFKAKIVDGSTAEATAAANASTAEATAAANASTAEATAAANALSAEATAATDASVVEATAAVGVEKSVTVFIQAKHRENNKRLTFTRKTDLIKYYNSYLKIRRAFEPGSKDIIFGGKFDETKCFFVMYTTAKDDTINKIYEGSFADNLNELIGTGGCCTQPSYTNQDLDFLCKLEMKEQIKQLAKFIYDKSDSVNWMSNDLILRYHVILAHNVLQVSEIQPEGHRIASFRQDFFTTNEEFLVLFKNILCLEVLKKRKSQETDVQSLLLKFLSEPSDVTTLSKLIGSVLIYKNRKLKFVGKSMTDDLKRQLDKAIVSQSTVYEAAELAAKEYLLSLKLKVPAFFGNKDLAIRGKYEKIERRLNYLTSKIIEILKKSKPDNVVTIDETEGDGFLQLNGGIASAVGNVLVFDESSKLLKFTDNCESLSNLAKTWYESLKSKIENLHEYKLDVKVKKFPKLSFERGEHDVSLVRDFYDKLLFYTNQADQNGVEKILRRGIEDHPCSDVNNFRVRSDMIFLKYHDAIQKLWLTPEVVPYLTKDSKIYENAVTNAMNEPLMGVLNKLHNIKKKDYTFNEKALKAFEKLGPILGTVIVIATGSCVLTVAKVEQYLGNTDRVVLDLEYIFQLSLKNYNTLCKELKNTTEEKLLIIVCHNFQDPKNSGKRIENIAKANDGKPVIIITNKTSVDIMTKYFSQVSNVLNDERSVFTDLSVESQKKFLATSKIKVQGEDVSLADIIGDDESKELIEEDIFNKLINNGPIEIGETATYNNYGKRFYIDRRVSRTKNQKHDKFDDVKDKVLKTFYDLEDNVVLITGELGMGKSTLLTHLSLKTKERDPKVWIVRINLPEHEIMVRILKENTVNTSDFFKFMCQAALGEEYDKRQKEEWRKEEGELTIELEDPLNGTVFPMKCLGGKSKLFQLKMFLHYYNTGNLIFLFDGLDEIKISSKWQFETAVLSLRTLVRSISRKHKVWITSRSLNIIEQELGPSYKLENFSRPEQDTYLNKVWKFKIQLNVPDLKNIMENDCFVDSMHFFLAVNHNKIEYLRGYALFLEFFKMESSVVGIDFPYDKYYNKFMNCFGLCNSTISCFPDGTMPWDLSALAQRFRVNFEDMPKRSFPRWQLHPVGSLERKECRVQMTNIK